MRSPANASRYLERVTITSRAEWRAWLATHHAQPDSIWLVTHKKSSGGPYVPYNDIVEEALCFGWIDSRPAKLDEKRSMLLLSPRRPRSGWSKVNKDRLERLLAAGLVAAPGLARIEQAKADGSWSSLDDVDALVIPDDLKAALEANGDAPKRFGALNKSLKRGLLEQIQAAKRPETRARRIAETVRQALLGST